MDETEDTATYHVVVNDEEQYSIWPVDRPVPDGWYQEGTTGSRQECLDHIEQVWTDMRPASLRRWLAEQAEAGPAEEPAEPEVEEDPLPVRLSRAPSAVEVSLRPERTVAALREAIDREYVFLTFTETRGGTELGVRLDTAGTDLSGGDFAAGTGTVRLVGTLTLDYTPVRCSADIDLASLAGQGRLELLAPA